jgi:Asp-tRNA(Asn)/Glu-tRNA(Gln) amidotransferase A subunit family amidase
MDHLFQEFDFLILPCAPMSVLEVGIDHSQTRPKILRYTTPASLAGTPTVALTSPGGGVQLIAARGSDARLLAFAASLGKPS